MQDPDKFMTRGSSSSSSIPAGNTSTVRTGKGDSCGDNSGESPSQEDQDTGEEAGVQQSIGEQSRLCLIKRECVSDVMNQGT